MATYFHTSFIHQYDVSIFPPKLIIQRKTYIIEKGKNYKWNKENGVITKEYIDRYIKLKKKLGDLIWYIMTSYNFQINELNFNKPLPTANYIEVKLVYY